MSGSMHGINTGWLWHPGVFEDPLLVWLNLGTLGNLSLAGPDVGRVDPLQGRAYPPPSVAGAVLNCSDNEKSQPANQEIESGIVCKPTFRTLEILLDAFSS